jgi:hypothetical protein
MPAATTATLPKMVPAVNATKPTEVVTIIEMIMILSAASIFLPSMKIQYQVTNATKRPIIWNKFCLFRIHPSSVR